MKILLIAIHEEFDVKRSRNIGIQRICQYLNKNDIECEVCEIGIDDHEYFLQKSLHGEYSIIGVSSTYFFIEQELKFISLFYKAKERHQVIFIAGGNSPSQDDELWLNLGFDAVIRGYGEIPMLELAKKLQSSSSTIFETFSSINGLSYMYEGNVVRTPAQLLTFNDFHELNFSLEMDMVSTRDIYPTIFPEIKSNLYPEINRKYDIDIHQMGKTVNLYTSHACPNRCGYCCSSAFLNKIYGINTAFSIDAKSIYHLVVEYVKKRKVNFISFWDDDFCASKVRVEEFCNLIIAGKRNNTIPSEMKFQCQTRVLAFRHNRKTDIRLIKLMYDAGFILISLGVENFSQRLLNTPVMSKFGYNSDIAMDVINAIDENKICPSVNFMICVPEATPQEILFNIETLIKLQKMFISVNIGFYIDSYPGSKIYKDSRYPTTQKNIVSPLNNFTFMKEGYLIPHDNDVKSALNYYMTKGAKIEIETMQERFGNRFLVKKDIYLMNLLKCRAMCKTLPESEKLMEKLSIEIDNRYNRILELISHE